MAHWLNHCINQVPFVLFSTMTDSKNQHSHQAAVLEFLVNMLNLPTPLFLLLASLLSPQRNVVWISSYAWGKTLITGTVRSKINCLQIYQRTKILALEQWRKIVIRLFLPHLQARLYPTLFIVYRCRLVFWRITMLSTFDRMAIKGQTYLLLLSLNWKSAIFRSKINGFLCHWELHRSFPILL